MKSAHRFPLRRRLHAIRHSALLRRFRHDTGGNIVIPLAICTALMVLIAGAGIDFARGYNAKVELQAAVDATALAANYDSNGLSDSKIRQNATEYFNAIYTPPEGAKPQLDVSVDKGTVTVTGTLALPALFGAILGDDTLDIGVESQTVVGKATFDVVMVLDNSGSMRGNKLVTLKRAAEDLAETLLEVNEISDRKDRVKVGLVPFTSFVNVGADKATASWIDQEGRSPIHWKNFEVRSDGTPDPKEFDSRYLTNGRPSRLTLFKQLRGTDWLGCVEARPSPYDVTNTPPSSSEPETLFVPQFAPDEPDTGNKKWGDRVYNSYLNDDKGDCKDDVEDVYSSTGMSRWEYAQKRLCKYRKQTKNFGPTWQKGPNYNCRTEPLTELTEKKSTILKAIKNLRADGNTNIHMGTVWGWRLLSKGAPFNTARTEEENEDGEHVRILIIMTDGQNTYGSRGQWFMNTQPEAYGYGAEERLGRGIDSSWEIANKMDSRLATTCSNAKADGVQVYTIAFKITDLNTVRMMLNCATTQSMAFDAKSNSDLVDAFERIAGDITRLRLNK